LYFKIDFQNIFCGVIPAQDYDFLYKAGVAAIFGPGSPVAKASVTIMEILLEE
jgi:methylmalonyl-CoA mutase